MAELTISINSRPFAIACADGEEQRVSRLAEDLAARLGEVKKNVNGAGDSHLLVLVGLTLCDELNQLNDQIEGVRQDVEAAGKTRMELEKQVKEFEKLIATSLVSATEKIQSLNHSYPPKVSEIAALNGGGLRSMFTSGVVLNSGSITLGTLRSLRELSLR